MPKIRTSKSSTFQVSRPSLQVAFKKGAERKPSYLLITAGVIVHESMSLLLTPFAANLMTREALMCAFAPVSCRRSCMWICLC